MTALRTIALLLGVLLLGSPVFAAETSYNYISASDLEARLNAHQSTNIVDIQVEEEFASHHIKGAMPTHAYPVKSEADRAKLAAAMAKIRGNADPVVVVCPRGAGGAQRTYDYLLGQGVAADRLLILEKGQGGWTCAPLTEGR